MAGVKGRSGGRNKKPINWITCNYCGKLCGDRTPSRTKTKSCSHLCAVRFAAKKRTRSFEYRKCVECNKDFRVLIYIKQNSCSIVCANRIKARVRKRNYKYTCKNCGVEFIPKEVNRTTFCGRSCAYEYKRRINERMRVVQDLKHYKECNTCGSIFKGNGRFCNTECRQVWNEVSYSFFLDDKREEIPIRKESCVCAQCGKHFIVNVRKPGSSYRYKYCSKKCVTQRENHRNHGLPAGVLNELILKQGGKCALCGFPFGQDILDKPSIDHIFPRSKGGSNELSNLQAAHMYCNSIKSDRLDICTIMVGA